MTSLISKLSLIPNPYKILILVLVVIGIFGYGYHKGASNTEIKVLAEQAEIMKEEIKKVNELNAKNLKEAVERAKKEQKVKIIYKEIKSKTEDIIEKNPNIYNDCKIGDDMLEQWNNANKGEVK